MITKFTLFETLNQGKPEENDYVICHSYIPKIKARKVDEIYSEFITTHIGQIVCIYTPSTALGIEFTIKFQPEEIPTVLINDFIVAWRGDNTQCYDHHEKLSEIQYWSKNKSDLERLLTQKRFDL